MKTTDNTLEVSNLDSSHRLFIKLNADKNKAILEIDDVPVYEFLVENDGGRILLKENNILTIWFNAWRYEREEQYATIALMKTIAYAMGTHQSYRKIKPLILRGLTIITKDIFRNLALKYVMTERGMDELETNLFPKLERLAEIDKDTIYFDGIKKIEEEMRKIVKEYPENRAVVFIDDLDRCSPETALEVFESIKVEIDGFVFIVGLSREALYKLIKAKYEKMGLTDITPDEYIRKIIQIDIIIQKWTDDSIKDLIYHLSNKVDKDYRKQIIKNSDLIARGVESNPRQLKRFLNRFIVSLTVDKSLDATKFLVGELLNAR